MKDTALIVVDMLYDKSRRDPSFFQGEDPAQEHKEALQAMQEEGIGLRSY